jgi:N-6 DNA Methylase
LFDRKDSDGNAALTPAKLARLHADGILRRLHTSFASILADFEETYRLFDWLNAPFNGDLFPGKGDTPTARSRGWAAEKKIVTKRHLALLADFISGKVDIASGQGSLWPQYAFDVIPLEFISSIYETFVTKRVAKEGIFYTPPHLVDFVLDRVLPWEGAEWDLVILDPACGSGIFLVKALQRLIHRWKRAHKGQQIRAETLRRFLERNLFGDDKDPHAVRVACFSLYLAMCDEVDPRHYWTQINFPDMRGRRLVCSDFFAEDHAGFRSIAEAGAYDLIVGNAPWGENVLTDAARYWADSNLWPIANKDVGTLFLAKAARLLSPSGRVAMIQSANSLLFNRGGRAAAFRKKLFTECSVEQIINLSALRFEIFTRKAHAKKKSVAPICVAILSGGQPQAGARIIYISPKHLEHLVDELKIVIEPQDQRWLTTTEAACDASAWPTLMWGGGRDRALLTRLKAYSTLANPPTGFTVNARKGIVIGDKEKFEPRLSGSRMFDSDSFPTDSLLYLDAETLPQVSEVRTDAQDSTDFTAFSWPQLIIKKGWQQLASRFQARLIKSGRHEGTLCTQSYVTVHVPGSQEALLDAACLSLNSMFATYYLLLTSGRFASYRPEPLVLELLAVPLPAPRPDLLSNISNQKDIDSRLMEAFGFRDSERVLIEDLFNYTVPDFQGDDRSPGRQPTVRKDAQIVESQLTAYCAYFMRVLRAGFGQDKSINATIFQEEESNVLLPYRLVSFELGGVQREEIMTTRMKLPQLLNEFDTLNRQWKMGSRTGSIYQQRIARVYQTINGIPTVFVIKPDMHRYWTRSAGLSDADEVALDLFSWHQKTTSSEVA